MVKLTKLFKIVELEEGVEHVYISYVSTGSHILSERMPAPVKGSGKYDLKTMCIELPIHHAPSELPVLLKKWMEPVPCLDAWYGLDRHEDLKELSISRTCCLEEAVEHADRSGGCPDTLLTNKLLPIIPYDQMWLLDSSSWTIYTTEDNQWLTLVCHAPQYNAVVTRE